MTPLTRFRRWLLLAGLLLASLAWAPGAYAVSLTSPVSPVSPVSAARVLPPALAVPAHAGVVSVVPADGAVLDRGPSEVVLTFDEDVSPTFVQVALTRDGVVVPCAPPTVSGPVVRLVPTSRPGPGDYVVAFRVVSVDSHPVSGQSGFRVSGPAGSTAPATTTAGPATVTPVTPVTPVTAPSASTAAAPAAGANGGPSPAIAIGGGLLLAAAGLGAWAARRR